MNISITLIIPIYNVEKYLNQCLDSIVEQTVPFDEVILINDGSTDQSLSICESYILRFKYFKLITQENKGLSAARNTGVCHAEGEYIMFLDSDDYLRPDTVMCLKRELLKSRQDAVYFDAAVQCEDGFSVREDVYDRSSICADGIEMNGWEFFVKSYPKKYVVSACMAVYRKRVIKDAVILFPEGVYYEDNYFSFAFMIQAQSVTHISKKLYQRRIRQDSIVTGAYSEKKFIDYIKVILLIWKEASIVIGGISLEQKMTLLRFISDHCSCAFDNFQLCMNRGIVLGDEAKDAFFKMFKEYETLTNLYDLDGRLENLALINQISMNLQRAALCYPENRSRGEKKRKRLAEEQKQLYKILLLELPLNKKAYKIGIYGMGSHTAGLLAIFESIVGEIACNLFFLDSYQESGIYRGKKVIHYKQIDGSFDMIIISSFLYEQEMIRNIRKVDKKIAIHTFYKTVKEDVFGGYENFLPWDVTGCKK